MWAEKPRGEKGKKNKEKKKKKGKNSLHIYSIMQEKQREEIYGQTRGVNIGPYIWFAD